jgi:hypothetical protein
LDDVDAGRLREGDLAALRTIERVAAFGLDLGLVMGSSEVARRHPPHHPSPAQAKHPAGQDPEASLWRLYVTHSNALFLHESQSFLGKKSLEGPKSRSSYGGFESQSLRQQISANRTARPETCENCADFTGDLA